METNRWNIHDLTQMALLVALLSASAYLAFPIPITLVTVTAQTLVLNLIALLLLSGTVAKLVKEFFAGEGAR